MQTKNKIFLSITGIITVLLITISLSYAYFTANLTGGEDSTTITVTGGTMNIVYNGGANINVANIIPSDNPVATKTFTVTGNNTTDVEMAYKISLVVEKNTFSNDALKYKLISYNTDNNGIPATSIEELTDIPTGANTIELGVGSFRVPTGGNKTHTYNLEIYFLNQDYNQNEDQGKQIKIYVLTENYIPPKLLGQEILAQGGGTSVIEAKGAPDFSVSNGISGLYASDDEYGTSYYYRGVKTELNNNVIFGGFQWKIIRINGDGSIRLLYNGTEAQFNTNGTMNNTGLNTQISTSEWNTNYNDAKYVGYMYGGANGVASTTRNGTVSTAATYNETNTNMKTVLDNWYVANISGKPFETNVVDNLFCNDRQLSSEVGGLATGPGYGTEVDTYYAAYQRLEATKNPTLKCAQKNDRFTKNDTTIGNGALTYPVGLITADEASMAGLRAGSTNNTNYLYTNQYYWLLSPSYMNSGGYAFVFVVFSLGYLNYSSVENAYGVRPAVSINSSARATGTGSATDPFRVQI